MNYLYASSAVIFLTQFVTLSRGQSKEFSTDGLPPRIWPHCKAVRRTEDCDGSYVQFYLHTRRGSEPVEVTDNTNNITSTDYDELRPNIILIHGYNSDMNLDTFVTMRKEYLKYADMNVWAVDFSSLVKSPCYPFAVYNVRYIGRCISQLVVGLRDLAVGPYIHVIGFSLGAHVAGRVGFEVQDEKLARITGLDPALPLFYGTNVGERLSKSDADFVDVMHTNMFMQGHYSALGHVDYYMNGGYLQPGCTGGPSERSGCDHHRAAAYFAESINSEKGFWGARCSGLISILMDRCSTQPPFEEMGDAVSTRVRGQFYVRTAAESPFALGYPSQRLRLNKTSLRKPNSYSVLVTP